MSGKRAIIIGASSGIGRELALLLAGGGWTVGVTARRTSLLESLSAENRGIDFYRTMDVCDPAQAVSVFVELLALMGGADLVIISAGTGFLNPEMDWEKERATIEVNVTGFAAIANSAMRYFMDAGRGHLVGITSIASLRGGRESPAYNASKAFDSSYLEALRLKAIHAGFGETVAVTDVMPGWVDTDMAKGEGLFWLAPPRVAAKQILSAVNRGKKRVVITRRWRLIALFYRLAPDRLFARF